MSKKHKKLLGDAQEAINNLFGDTSVGPDTTLGSLEELVADIDNMIVALKSDNPDL